MLRRDQGEASGQGVHGSNQGEAPQKSDGQGALGSAQGEDLQKSNGQGALGRDQGEDAQKSDWRGVLGSDQGEDAHSDAGEERTLGPESFSPSQNENANDRIQNRCGSRDAKSLPFNHYE
jgi:hypothetical protein